jgi:PPOX class probable F420-dependent enzyme
MDIPKALAFIAETGIGTLATLMPDGRPHVSVVTGVVVDGTIWISVTESRVKARNIRNDPRVAFLAGTSKWAAVEGTASLREGEGVLEDLRLYYRLARGEHPDWADYDRAMIADRRRILEISPIRAYGAFV